MNVHSSLTHNSQDTETVTRPSADGEQGEKMWHVHTAERYSAMKRNEVLMHVKTWVNLENRMLKETQKDTYWMTPFI